MSLAATRRSRAARSRKLRRVRSDSTDLDSAEVCRHNDRHMLRLALLEPPRPTSPPQSGVGRNHGRPGPLCVAALQPWHIGRVEQAESLPERT